MTRSSSSPASRRAIETPSAASTIAFAGTALGLIRRVLRDPSAAEEVLQEVFWQVWQEAPRYDPSRGSPIAWVSDAGQGPGNR